MLFPFGKLVYGKDFAGRNDEIKRIKMYLENGENLVLIAPRRMGKSSLVWHILEKLRKDHYIGNVDFFETASKLELAQQITQSLFQNRHKHLQIIENIKSGLQNVMKNIELKHSIEDFNFILKFAEYDIDEKKILKESLNCIEKIAQKDKKRIIFFFDEFGDIDKLDGIELQKLFRSVLQKHKNAQYIFAGSQESIMKNIFTKSSAPFFRFARIEYLDPITFEDYSIYIKIKYDDVNIKITDGIIKKIYEFTDGQPYYTQQICQNIYYIVTTNKKRKISDIDLRFAIENSLAYEQPYLDSLWSSFLKSKEQLNVLLSLVKNNKNIYSLQTQGKNIYRTLTKLIQKGIIRKKSSGHYEIIDPLFKKYLQNKVNIH